MRGCSEEEGRLRSLELEVEVEVEAPWGDTREGGGGDGGREHSLGVLGQEDVTKDVGREEGLEEGFGSFGGWGFLKKDGEESLDCFSVVASLSATLDSWTSVFSKGPVIEDLGDLLGGDLLGTDSCLLWALGCLCALLRVTPDNSSIPIIFVFRDMTRWGSVVHFPNNVNYCTDCTANDTMCRTLTTSIFNKLNC